MSENKYVPEEGDRIRVTLEGVAHVRGSLEPGSFDLITDGDPASGNWIRPNSSHVVSVEKLSDPLPTTPGSVVRQRGEFLYVRNMRGFWQSLLTSDSFPSGEFDRTLDEVEVIFDAGRVQA